MSKRFNNKGDEICDHEFGGGLCSKCLCPETSADQIRAENAFYNAERMEGQYQDDLGFTPNREQAILYAWRLNRRK